MAQHDRLEMSASNNMSLSMTVPLQATVLVIHDVQWSAEGRHQHLGVAPQSLLKDMQCSDQQS